MFMRHATIEKNVILMLVLTLITVSIGGLVQIIPLFTIESTVEKVAGVRPPMATLSPIRRERMRVASIIFRKTGTSLGSGTTARSSSSLLMKTGSSRMG